MFGTVKTLCVDCQLAPRQRGIVISVKREKDAVLSSIRSVIFDMDGTITQTNQLIFDSFNYIAEKYQGKRYSEREITAMFGPPEEGALLPMVGHERIETVLKEYLDFYQRNHSRLAKLYPGIVDVIEFLRTRGCKLALFTGKGVHTTTITLQEFGLQQYFDYVVTGNDVVNHKPSAEGIRNIIQQFAFKPEEFLMVGDSVSDVKASREAGVKMAAVLWDSYAKERVQQMETDYKFHTVADFFQWLKTQFD